MFPLPTARITSNQPLFRQALLPRAYLPRNSLAPSIPGGAFGHFSCHITLRDFRIAFDQIGVDAANQVNKKTVRCERAPGTRLIGSNSGPVKNFSHSDCAIAIFWIRFNKIKDKV